MPNLDEFLENPQSLESNDVRTNNQKLLDAIEALQSQGECFDCGEYCSCGTINGLKQHVKEIS